MIKLRPLSPDEKIAVAVPTRNRPAYLSILISCILNQTYTNWMLLINDQSDTPVDRDHALRDLFNLARRTGHDVRIIRTDKGAERHQSAMEAVPEDIELILRIDDDMFPEPVFLENVLKPFRFFPSEPLAAVGGLHPEPGSGPMDLDIALGDPEWIPRFDKPDWRLQGHFYYNPPEILEAESLGGGAILYRRSAVEDAGGWAVAGYSDLAFREESDLCARLYAKGYTMMITTEAIVWHLLAPSGGARKYLKTGKGNIMISDKGDMESDERVFAETLRVISEEGNSSPRGLRRYKLSELESGIYKPAGLNPTGRTLGIVKRLMRKYKAFRRHIGTDR